MKHLFSLILYLRWTNCTNKIKLAFYLFISNSSQSQTKKGNKGRGIREEKRLNGVKKGNYLYFVSLFNIGHYDCKKNREEFLKNSRGGERFSEWP